MIHFFAQSASFLISFPLFSTSTLAMDQPSLQLQQLHDEVKASKKSKVSYNATGLAARLNSCLAGLDFTASEGSHPQILMSALVAKELLSSIKPGKPDSGTPESEALVAVEAFLVKVAAHIDDKWVFQQSPINVAPPAGTPNAAFGMNPNAIEDPKLRQQYIATIAAEHAKSLKNRQQALLRRARSDILSIASGMAATSHHPGWSHADLLAHFAKDNASRAILSEHLQKAKH